MADGQLAASYGVNINTTVSGNANSQVSELSKKLEAIEGIAKKDGDALGVYLTNKVKVASREVSVLEGKLSRAGKVMMNTSGGINPRAFAAASQAYERYSKQLEEAKKLLSDNEQALDRYSEKWDELADHAEEAGETLSSALSGSENQADALTASLGKLGKMAAAAFTIDKAIDFGKQVFQVRAEMQSLEMSYTTMLRSKEKADALLKDAVEFSATTPFDLQQVASASKQLLAFGSSAEHITDELRMMGDVAAGLNVPLNDLIYLYGTLRASGRVTTIDIRQFAQRGIPIYDELAKVMGVAKEEIGDLVTAGKVGFQDIENAFKDMTAEGSQFGGLMNNLSKTFEGRISNIGDALYQMKNEIGKALEEPISKGLSVVSALVDNYKAIGAAIGTAVMMFGTYKAAVLAAAAAEKIAAVTSSSLNLAITLTTLKTKLLTVAQSKLNTVMMMNPYALAASAMAGLVMWSLRYNSAVNDGTKAQKKFNEYLEETEAIAARRNEKQNELIKIIEDENAATDRRIYAMRELLSSYPALLDKYQNEYDALSQIKNIKGEIAALDLQQAFDNDAKKLEELTQKRDELQGKINDAKGDIYNSDEADYAASALASYNDELKLTNQQIELLKEKMQSSDYDILYDGPARPANLGQTTETAKNKKYWEDQIAANQAKLDKIASDQLESTEAKNLKAIIDNAQKELDKYSAKKGEAAGKKAQQLAEVMKGMEEKAKEYEESAAEAVNSAEAEIAMIKLRAQEDSAQKSLDLMDLEHQQKLATLNRNYKKEIDKIKAEELKVYKAQHGGSSAGFSFNESTDAMAQSARAAYNASVSVESERYEAEKTSFARQANEQRLKNQLDYLKTYGNYKEREYAITKEYDERIAKEEDAYAKMSLSQEKENALYELQKQYLGVYQLIFEKASNLSNNQLEQAIEETQKAIKKAADSGDVKALSELYDELIEKREELAGRTSGWGFAAISKGFSSLTDARKKRAEASVYEKYGYSDKASQLNAEAQSWETTGTQAILKGAQQIADAFEQIGDSLQNFEGALGEFGKFFSGLSGGSSTIMSFLNNFDFKTGEIKDKGAAYASIISGTVEIIGMIGSSITANKKAQEEWNSTIDDCARKLDRLNLDKLDYKQSNIFGVEDPYAKAAAGALQYGEALKKLNQYTSDLGAGQVQTGTKKAVDWGNVGKGAATGAGIGAAAASIIPGIGTAIGAGIGAVAGAISGLFSTKTVAVYENLASKYGKLCDDEYELLPEILADYDKMDDKTKKLIDDWGDVRDKMKEAKQNITDTISTLAGDMGSTLSDALVTAFTNGDIFDAVDSFTDYANDAIGKIIQQQIFAAYFRDLFDSMQSDMEASLSEGGDGSIVDDIKRFNNDYKSRLEAYNQAMLDAQEEASAEGYKLWNTDSERTAGTKGIATASQDSVSELNGRATAIQGHVAEINAWVADMRLQNASIVANTLEILHTVMGIHDDTTTLTAQMEGLSDTMGYIRSDVSWIRDKGLRI